VETTLIGGRLLKVYKNLWPSVRVFWLEAVARYRSKTYIIFNEQRLTYGQAHDAIVKTASLFQNEYKVHKGRFLIRQVSSGANKRIGDRVVICSRNCPEFLIAFWACRELPACQHSEWL
jgi:acyl-CoA synthetase (AMP-forming)/AMP-acid ligase II